MTSFFRFLLVSFAFTLGTINLSHAASFDCSKATTETEIAICSDPELSALDEVLAGVSENNRNSVAKIIESYANECEGSSSSAPLKVAPDNIIELKLESGTSVTVVMANFECPDSVEGDFPWTNSTGFPSYYIVGDFIYEGSEAAGVSLSEDLIITTHFGIHCERADNKIFPNIDVCFSVMYWHEYFETFVSFHGKHKLFKRNF